MNALLSTAYFGPIQWYQKLYRADHVDIEACETFQKQTYRNRCVIATANGPQALTVPVASGGESIRDVRISDHGNWHHLHWNAVRSAYGDSPFFMYYEDDLRPFFEKRWEFLFDFNEAIRETVCNLLDIHPVVGYTSIYEREAVGVADFRDVIKPKAPGADPDFTCRPYYQVYEQKTGFLSNLSIIDLLLNLGPEAIFYL